MVCLQFKGNLVDYNNMRDVNTVFPKFNLWRYYELFVLMIGVRVGSGRVTENRPVNISDLCVFVMSCILSLQFSLSTILSCIFSCPSIDHGSTTT